MMDSTCVELAEAISAGTTRLGLAMVLCAVIVSVTMLYTEIWGLK